jgi:hypothetical protein
VLSRHAAVAVTAAVAILLLAMACTRSTAGPGRTVTVGTDRVPAARLTDASAGLCQAKAAAATDPTASRAAFYDRAHDAVHTVARALEPVDRNLAAQLLEAKEKVESEVDARPPAPVVDDLARLSDVYRAGLGRLAIAAPPCDK